MSRARDRANVGSVTRTPPAPSAPRSELPPHAPLPDRRPVRPAARVPVRRTGYATLCWALAHGGFGLVCALTGTPVFFRGPDPGPVGLNWFVVAVAVLATAATGAALAATRTRPPPALRAVLWSACGLSAVSAFGLLMDLVTLVFGQRVDSAAGAVNHTLGALGVVLLTATARASRPAGDRARTADPARPATVPAPRRVRLAVHAGTAAFLPYAAMKLIWAFGGTFAGMSGAEMTATSRRNGASGLWLTLESWGLDPTVLLAAVGVLVAHALVWPWGQVVPRWVPALRGRRVPRWLPLAPALVGAATLAPYGTLGVGYLALGSAGMVTVPRGDFATRADALLVSWIGIGAFACYGVGLLVAARSYWLRTRPMTAGRAPS